MVVRVLTSFHISNFTITHAKAIEAFHRTVGGRMFKHVKMRTGDNMTCQFVIGSKVGQGPSIASPNQTIKPYIHKQIVSQNLQGIWQLKHQNTTMERQNLKGNDTCRRWTKIQKMKAKVCNGSLGLLPRLAPVSFLKVVCFGEEMGWKWLQPSPF